MAVNVTLEEVATNASVLASLVDPSFTGVR
jgi:hypothetical protein